MEIGAAPARDPGLLDFDPIGWGRVQRSARRRLGLSIGKFARLFKYLNKHFPGQLAGLRVLVRGVVRGE